MNDRRPDPWAAWEDPPSGKGGSWGCLVLSMVLAALGLLAAAYHPTHRTPIERSLR